MWSSLDLEELEMNIYDIQQDGLKTEKNLKVKGALDLLIWFYYMGPGDRRCRSKKEVFEYINRMNRAAECTSLTEGDRPVLLLH
ncbi:unnamed protein product [Camellia sinensis]